ncbi:MAG: response regulator transcription factor [Acidobacteria bacterium]|nr:response regulator transcription factor [Acidobacteriota bacterium]
MTAARIVFAREDLSIPGAVEVPLSQVEGAADTESRFFSLVRENSPDVIVLDVSRNPIVGLTAIIKIRQRYAIPILAVCDTRRSSPSDFLHAGAADSIGVPIDLLNQKLQQIIKITASDPRQHSAPSEIICFAGFIFYPLRNLLAVKDGSAIGLTASESRLLLHLAAHPWRLCPRGELARALFSDDQPNHNRTIEHVINQLRHKFVRLRGSASRALIKTEPGCGYLLAAAISSAQDWPRDELAA